MPANDAQAAEPEVSPPGPVTPVVELRHRLVVDVPLTVTLAGGLLLSALVRDSLTPSQCRWCEPAEVNALDNAFREAFRRSDTTPASTMSHVFAYGLGPAAAVGLDAAAAAADRRANEIPLNVLLIGEATFGALLLNEGLKVLFLRERPYIHALSGEAKEEAIAKGDALVSFPSGHTAATFAMAAAGGTVATMRGYRLAPMTWLAGLIIGITTGYLRIAADRHYFTDVLAGAAVGTGVGITVPLLFHRPYRPVEPGSAGAARSWLSRFTLGPPPDAIGGAKVGNVYGLSVGGQL